MFSEFLADLNAEFTSENQGMSADVITKAFLATEEEFLALDTFPNYAYTVFGSSSTFVLPHPLIMYIVLF
ncbi:unnamed protein product [Trifolium pratense]|uniref:Uncharacterized protein n=1 Tax=Trifolium pratense TaxID=57577 RepID=A0ACB0IJ42_TRIPR|nr:unnamed protein product [Trifolium pratense]